MSEIVTSGVGEWFSGPTAEAMRDELAALGHEDPEAAHNLEDKLAATALAAIRDGHPSPQELAREVLVVLDADYERWTA